MDFEFVMKAMVLCAGFGTRLGDLTRETPKPMLDLDGQPMLAWILAHLRQNGFSMVGINLHFQADTIQNHFGEGDSLGVKLIFSREPELLGTAGGAGRIGELLCPKETFLIQYGDVITDADLGEMVRVHRERGAVATIMVHERERSNSVVEFGDDGRVIRLLERPDENERKTTSSRYVNSGICVAEPELLKFIPAGRAADLPRDVFPALIAEGKLFAYPLNGFRCAVDSPERLETARLALRDGQCRITRPAS